MKIWYQLISSETAMSNFLSTTKTLCDAVAAPGTTVEVHGTPHGALGDQYRSIWHYDVREFVETALKLRREGGYDAFVIANSLDTGLVELRELLDIPVISFMEVLCFTACTMGERFGMLVQHPKMVSRYREIVTGYGLASRLASIENTGHSPGNNAMFTREDEALAYVAAVEAAGERAVEAGAEVLFLTGSTAALLAARGVYTIAGVPLLHSYGLLVKAAESAIAMHRITGHAVSRRNYYQGPPTAMMNRVADVRGLPMFRTPTT
ncbi:aspartate/glutamate racemase family protein [Falsiroseomonas sp.]|jgi:allantoin racemase|uniref:aspartate/glutamate racemase family protein n=1 Tax=Falsiroseomonas sp. TaxID=2870721 RepID=UPI003F717338